MTDAKASVADLCPYLRAYGSWTPAFAGVEMSGLAMDEQAYVYIMASRRNGTIYIGSTTDLVRRVWEHRNDVVPGFTRKYRCHALVWYEAHGCLESARLREKQMKEWRRAWKVREIEGLNAEWDDLYARIALP